VLLEAYAGLAERPPLVLVGTRAADTPAEFPAGTTVLTYMPHRVVMALWRRSLFGVSPSIAPEAFPTVVHEAMSCGRAMIGANMGGYLDMIEDGETGLLVPPGDPVELRAAMARLIGDPDLRERLGRSAERKATDYTPAAVLPRIERLFRETVAESARR
jgi:glycosyltransferase involved in cell wall biosynthesis